jgi:hypothetical protein
MPDKFLNHKKISMLKFWGENLEKDWDTIDPNQISVAHENITKILKILVSESKKRKYP